MVAWDGDTERWWWWIVARAAWADLDGIFGTGHPVSFFFFVAFATVGY